MAITTSVKLKAAERRRDVVLGRVLMGRGLRWGGDGRYTS